MTNRDFGAVACALALTAVVAGCSSSSGDTASSASTTSPAAASCRTWEDFENHITDADDALHDGQAVLATAAQPISNEISADYLGLVHADDAARAAWLPGVRTAIAQAPPGPVRAAMQQAPAFDGYWKGIGTPQQGAAIYAYSLVLEDVIGACADSDAPLKLTKPRGIRLGLPKSVTG